MLRSGFLMFLIMVSSFVQAQAYRVHGKVTNNKLEPLAFVSIQTKQTSLGTTTKEDGTFELTLEEGQYDLVISMVGYKPQILNMVINRNTEQNVILEEDDSKTMEDIVIRVKARDRSEEMIKNVIRNKDNVLNAPGAYSCNVYIKAIQRDSTGRRTRKQNPDQPDPNADLASMAMAEISLRYDFASEQQTKEERLGVKKDGNSQRLFFLSTTEGSPNFYNNLVKLPSVAAVPFISPVSYSGLVAYKYKTIKIEKVGNHKNYTISVKPRQLSNATVEGELTISDSTWTILHTRFSFPSYHLPEYDFFEVEQQYNFVQGKAWMITNEKFTYYSKVGKGKLSGQTSVTFTNYELNKEFPKRYFGSELSATAKEAYEKDSSFWVTVRTEPLTDQEIRFVRYRDSIFRATHTKEYLDSVDRVNNQLTWKKLGIFGQTLYQRDKDRTIVLPPVISLFNPFQFGGLRFSPNFFYYKTYPNKKNLRIYFNPSYGFRNHDVNGAVQIDKLYNPFNRGLLTLSAGREFEFIYAGDAWINLIQRGNFYLNNHVSVGNDIELANGLFLYTDLEMALRRSVSNYKTNPNIDSLVSGSLIGGVLDRNQPIPFDPYNALYSKIQLNYTIKQPYIREPLEKIVFTSKWPTLSVLWKKGVPDILKSKVNFDYLEFGISQQINAGIVGVMRYKIKTGKFYNQRDLRLIDYKFQRQGDPLLFMNPDEAFQALDSTFPTFKRFYQAHMVHEFNGFILNKIPLLKKLQLKEIAGGGFLIAPERGLRYAEAFTGIERVIKSPFNPLAKFKLGVYVVGSVANKFNNPVQFKLGLTTWDIRRNRWN